MDPKLVTKILVGIKYVLFLAMVGLLIRAYFKIKAAGCVSVMIDELSMPGVAFALFVAIMFADDILRSLVGGRELPSNVKVIETESPGGEIITEVVVTGPSADGGKVIVSGPSDTSGPSDA